MNISPLPHKKLQSAMEYLMTYGWAILIIAVVIGVLYAMGIFNGSGLLGSFCTAQTGYFCANPILSTNSPTLNVTIGQDTRLEWPAWKIFAVRGTAFNASSPNITGSGAFYNGEKQIVAIPLNSILGNYIPIGTPFSGSLWAEYCNTPNCNTPDQVSEIGIFSTKAAELGYVTTSVSTSSISTTSTSSTTTTSITTPAPTTTIAPSGIIYSVPITLTNSQSSNTPAPFQQMVNITESTYSSYLAYNNNFANFEYFYSNGTIIPAWIESNSSGKLITWVNIKGGIPASSHIQIYLGFASKTTNLLSSSGTSGIGEAPQLSSTYAEYDDGASVFLAYGAFQGSSLPSDWSLAGSASFAGGSNGIKLISSRNSGGSAYTAVNLINTITEVSYYFNAVSDQVKTMYGAYATGWVPSYVSSSSYLGLDYGMFSGSDETALIQSGTALATGTNIGKSNVYLYTQSIITPTLVEMYETTSSSQIYPTYSLTNILSYSGNINSETNTLALYGGDGDGSVTSINLLWARVRAYPPNGIMPTAAFGVIQGGSPSVTVSPSSVSLLPGTDFTLTANASGGTSPYTYQWYNATSGTGIPIAGANSSTYTATAGSAAGTFDYYVTVTDSESPPQTAQSPNSVVTVSLPPSGITYYVPITLTNSQSSNTPAPFQQMVNISESAYPNYLTYNGNSANFEFFTSSGTVLPAWIESSNSGKLITWVKLPNGIPADSNTIIYLGFASNTVNLLSSSGTTGIGEAPQLPCGSTATSSCSTYGEYDDGANVFIHYGGGGPTGWSQFTFVGGTWSTANKYLQQTSTSGTYVGGPAALVESASYPATGNYILGMAFNYTIEADARVGIIAVATPTTAPDTFGYRFVGQQTSFGAGFLSFLNDFVGWVTNNVYQGAVSTPYTMTITDADGTWSGNLYSGYGEGSTILTSLAAVTYSANNYKGTNSGYVGISATYASSTTPGSDVANPLDVMWFYMRAYPPNGAMPTAAFGNGVTV